MLHIGLPHLKSNMKFYGPEKLRKNAQLLTNVNLVVLKNYDL